MPIKKSREEELCDRCGESFEDCMCSDEDAEESDSEEDEEEEDLM